MHFPSHSVQDSSPGGSAAKAQSRSSALSKTSLETYSKTHPDVCCHGVQGGSEECGFGDGDHGRKKPWWKGLSWLVFAVILENLVLHCPGVS